MMNETAAAQDSNRYQRLVRRKPGSPGPASAPDNAARLQRQFEVIFAANRDAFLDARVLDLMSSTGFWSLAALDAGARQLSGLNPQSARSKPPRGRSRNAASTPSLTNS